MRSMLLIAFVGLSLVAANTVPVYMWSSQSYFPSPICSSSVPPTDITEAFAKLTGTTTTSTFASTYIKNAGTVPQLMVTLRYPKLSSVTITKHAEQFQYLKTALSSAGSSLSVPFVIAPIASAAAPLSSDNCAAVLTAIESSTFAGVTQSIEVSVNNQDQCIAQIIATVAKKPSYVIAVTAAQSDLSITHDFAPHTPHVTPLSTQSLAFKTQAFGPKGAAYVYPGPQYITSNILIALLIGLMLSFILYIGVSCIMSVERPVRMSTVPLQLSKEY